MEKDKTVYVELLAALKTIKANGLEAVYVEDQISILEELIREHEEKEKVEDEKKEDEKKNPKINLFLRIIKELSLFIPTEEQRKILALLDAVVS